MEQVEKVIGRGKGERKEKINEKKGSKKERGVEGKRNGCVRAN